MTVRFRLQELLDNAEMSQGELSRMAGVSLTTVNRMAKNHTAQVSLATLDAISSALGCAPGDLVERLVEATGPRRRSSR